MLYVQCSIARMGSVHVAFLSENKVGFLSLFCINTTLNLHGSCKHCDMCAWVSRAAGASPDGDLCWTNTLALTGDLDFMPIAALA